MNKSVLAGFIGAILGISATAVLGAGFQDAGLAGKLDDMKAMSIVGNHRAAFRHDLAEDCDLAVNGGKINLLDSTCARRESWLEVQQFIIEQRNKLALGLKGEKLLIDSFLEKHARHIAHYQEEEFRKLGEPYVSCLDAAKKKFGGKK